MGFTTFEDAFNSFRHKLDGKLVALPEGMSYDAIAHQYKAWCLHFKKNPEASGFVHWFNRYITLTLELGHEPELNIGFGLPEDKYNSKEPAIGIIVIYLSARGARVRSCKQVL
jgi:hypothetical protein